jgi:hypothetical protein
MADPARAIARAFVRWEPLTWLLIGSSISIIQVITFVAAARAETVLSIDGGVGLLQNYGLGGNMVANAVLPYLARLYYANVMKAASAVSGTHEQDLLTEIGTVSEATTGAGNFVGTLYLFAFVGLAAWLTNVTFHLLGLAPQHWGHKVFDSPDHPLLFLLNRLNNLYSWVLIAPLCAHVFLWSTLLLPRMFEAAIARGYARFELLHSDRAGGFIAAENAKVIFNAALAVIYLEVTLHTGTFRLAHLEHILVYVSATAALLFGNLWAFKGLDRQLASLREREMEVRRRRVYEDDSLSFQILKYAHETRPPRLLTTFALKAVPIASSFAIKIAPLLQLPHVRL